MSHKDNPQFIWLLIEFSRKDTSVFEKFKPIFLDVYVKLVLNAKEKLTKGLCESFYPLLSCLSHEEFGRIVVPYSVKMLKRNPEIALESVEVLLRKVNLDSSNPDAIDAMFNVIKSVIGGSEGRLAFPYQRVGMVNALQELSNAPGGKPLSNLASSICTFLLSCYKDDGSKEVNVSVLLAIASWASRFADVLQPNLVQFFADGLKEKETLRRVHLRCLRKIYKNPDATTQEELRRLKLLAADAKTRGN